MSVRLPIDYSFYEAVFLDLDGTLLQESLPLPGAVALVERLQKQGVRFACLSNSGYSPAHVGERMRAAGMDLDSNHIYTAAAAACDYILQTFPGSQPGSRPRVYHLASESCAQLLSGRVDWVDSPAAPCDVILVGSIVNPSVTKERLFVALQLARAGAAIVGLCADRAYPSTRGLEFGSGAQTLMLSYAAQVEPVFCGKPEAVFFTSACRLLGADPQKCLMIGDNLESDIGGAKRVGMRTLLTLSGVGQPGDVDKLPDELRPDYVIPDLTALL